MYVVELPCALGGLVIHFFFKDQGIIALLLWLIVTTSKTTTEPPGLGLPETVSQRTTLYAVGAGGRSINIFTDPPTVVTRLRAAAETTFHCGEGE